ncbi:TPA: SDR family oxidoreductase, partial [Klebsiella pneumoniae]|nr:SDR family oxidoreductase [Klebsiella pneumoniae]
QKIPLGRPGRLTEIADLVIWLASDKASYITGTTINITGGKSRG